ncbi:MAG TPA: PGPGW domain-containing protein [Candidatus Angelobacter sp.]|nr:PGPGW domain-containing protein [Candidatus Angelobacter sp.]
MNRFLRRCHLIKVDGTLMPMMKRIFFVVLGWSFLVLGIAGLFLPVLQGILFILIGLTILSAEYHWARRWINKLRQKFPAADRQLHRFMGKHAKHFSGFHNSSAGE